METFLFLLYLIKTVTLNQLSVILCLQINFSWISSWKICILIWIELCGSSLPLIFPFNIYAVFFVFSGWRQWVRVKSRCWVTQRRKSSHPRFPLWTSVWTTRPWTQVWSVTAHRLTTTLLFATPPLLCNLLLHPSGESDWQPWGLCFVLLCFGSYLWTVLLQVWEENTWHSLLKCLERTL